MVALRSIPAHWYDEESLRRLTFPIHRKESVATAGGIFRWASSSVSFAVSPRLPRPGRWQSTIQKFAGFRTFQRARRCDYGNLLAAMSSDGSRPVQAKGGRSLIGEDQFRSRFAEWYGLTRFWYAKHLGESEGLPFVLEVALAHTEAEDNHRYFGLNFSPTFGDPLSDTQVELMDDLSGWGGVMKVFSIEAMSMTFPTPSRCTSPARPLLSGTAESRPSPSATN